jgi:hypothetical protein
MVAESEVQTEPDESRYLDLAWINAGSHATKTKSTVATQSEIESSAPTYPWTNLSVDRCNVGVQTDRTQHGEENKAESQPELQSKLDSDTKAEPETEPEPPSMLEPHTAKRSSADASTQSEIETSARVDGDEGGSDATLSLQTIDGIKGLRRVAVDLRVQMAELRATHSGAMVQAAEYTQSIVGEVVAAYTQRERDATIGVAQAIASFREEVGVSSTAAESAQMLHVARMASRIDSVAHKVDRIPVALEQQLKGMYPAEPLFTVEVESDLRGPANAATEAAIRVHNKGRAPLKVEILNRDGANPDARAPRQPWLTVAEKRHAFVLTVGHEPHEGMILLTLKVATRPVTNNGMVSGKVFLKTNDSLQKYVTIPITYTVTEVKKVKKAKKVSQARQWSPKIGGGGWKPNTADMSLKELKVALDQRGVPSEEGTREELAERLQRAMVWDET